MTSIGLVELGLAESGRVGHSRTVAAFASWVALLCGLTGCPINDLQKGTDRPDSSANTTGPTIRDGSLAGEASTDALQPADDDAQQADGDDATPGDAGVGAPSDGAPEGPSADGSSGTVYYSLDDPSRWTFFSASAVANGITKYSGAVFDGRYLYFVPQFNPPNVLRYDTQGGFTEPAAWTYYTPVPAIVAAGGSVAGSYTYLGGAFDGRYVYLAPFGTNTYAVRYDTQQPFSHDSSWSVFNAATVDPAANYWGVISDGRYAYFIPNKTTKVLAYDNTSGGDGGAGFTSAASFTSYDLGTGNLGYWGGAFDGTYVYLAPYSGSVAARHDTALPITAGWDVGAAGFDFNNNFLLGTAAHFWGGAFDGSRVYMIPNTTQSWTLVSYSTAGQFADYGAWSECALGTQLFSGTTSGQSFVGAAFDGKRLFLAPYGSPAGDSGAAPLPIVTYDTTQPLCPTAIATAYSKFDPTSVDGGPTGTGFEGAVFDGHYVYFVPHAGNVVARFEAKSVNSGLSPPSYKGSWW